MTLPAALAVPTFARLDEYFGAWAIESRAAAALWEMAAKMDLSAHVVQQLEARSEVRSTVEMVPTAGGKNVAVLKASGLLMKQQASMGRSTSTVQMRHDLRQAVANPDVSAILLHIDSPGGSVAGTEALANDIREARRTKPVYAQIEDLGASGAYWLASQCDKVFAENESSLIGDIGTVGHQVDSSEAAQKAGMKTLVFRSGENKGIGIPGAPITDSQKAHLQEMTDRSQQVFSDAVRRGRNLNDEQMATVTRGGAFVAKDAHAKGLIDGIQSTGATLAILSAVGRQTVSSSGSGAKGQSAMKTFDEFLSARGLAAESLSDATKAALTADWEALKAKASLPGDAANASDANKLAGITATLTTLNGEQDLKAQRKAAADEQRRQAEIMKVCAKHPDLAATAIEEGWEPIKAENAVLKLDQRAQGGPRIIVGSTSRDVSDEVIQAALCLRARLDKPEQHFKPEVLEVAEKHCAGWGLQRTYLHYALKNGWSGDPFSAFQSGNMGGLLRAAFSTIDLSNTLGGSAQKFARQGIRGAISTVWRMFSRIVTVNDFRPTDGRSIIEGNTYQEMGADGEFKHATLSESSWTNRARSFGLMLSITFQDKRNDDLGFLSNARTLLGRGAGRSILKEWFKEFMDNSTFFASGNANYAAGAGTALSSTSLATAEALFKAQTTEEGDEVDFEPAFVFVPLALDVTARELFQSASWNTGGASSSDRIANENIWAGKFEPVTASQLSNSSFTGYSTKAWYMLADPADAPVAEVCFLDGKEDPTIETAQTDFNTLGEQMRGHIHYGVKKAEHRAGVKMKGEA